MSGRALLILIALILFIVSLPYVAARREIAATEAAAARAARTQTGREIEINCPGPIMERFAPDTLEGKVEFDADGVPKNSTELSGKVCKGLRAVHARKRTLDFSCLAAGACGQDERQAALGVAVLTHELMHLRGIADEARAECMARKRILAVARDLGLSDEAGVQIAVYQRDVLEPELPSQYQGGTC